MGTTESIFVEPAVVEEIPSKHAPDNHRINATPPLTPSNRRRRNPQISIPSDASILQQQPQPPRSNNSSIQPSFQLNGMVFGMSKSGKRTLLHRLEGREPDFTGNVRGRESVENDIPSVVNTRYQPSSNLPSFNEHLQLLVRASKKANELTINNNDEYHFFVLLINPRHDRIKVHKYVSKRLHEILRIQGYEKITKSTSSSRHEPIKPFCVSLLRNFCDLIKHAEEGTVIQISDLITWTMEVLQEYSPSIEPLLQCIDTSLLNCYGLSALHHFIYQAYVQQKQYIVQRELYRIDEAITVSRQKAATLIIPYEQYLDNIERLIQGSASSSGIPSSNNSSSRNDDETASTATSSGINASSDRRRIIQVPKQQATTPNRDELSARNRAMSGGSSSTLPSMQHSLDNAKDALEAFLESDGNSDDEDIAYNRNIAKKGIAKEADDDTDEEDDFYMDDAENHKDVEKLIGAGLSKKEIQQTDANTTFSEHSLVYKATLMDGDSNTANTSNAEVNEGIPDEDNNYSESTQPLRTSVSLVDSNQNRDVSIDVNIIENDVGEYKPVESELDNVNNEVTIPPHKIDESTESLTDSNTQRNSGISVDVPEHSSNDKDDNDESEFFIVEGESEKDKKQIHLKQEDEDVSNDTEENNIKHPISDEPSPKSIDSPTVEVDLKTSNSKTVVNNGVIHSSTSTHATAIATSDDSTSNSKISDAARAALEIARQDFERMISQEEELERVEESNEKKKKKKDKHKKKGSTKEGKKSKQQD
jgi:hypothetical protein